MPLQLPPIPTFTRREALKAGIAVGASSVSGGLLALTGCASPNTSDKNKPMHPRVLLLADSHINADPAALSKHGVNMAHRLHTVTQHLQNIAPNNPFAFAILNGDAAHLDGQPNDYAQLLRSLQPLRELGQPLHITLGNHDDRDAFRQTVAAKLQLPAQAVPDKHVGHLQHPHAHWLLLDSLQHVNRVPGMLGQAQLDWLDQQLHQHHDKPAILVVHHPPVPDDPDRKPFSLQDHEPFWKIVAKHPTVAAVFHGHTHHWHPRKWTLKNPDGSVREVDLIGLPPTSYTFHDGHPWGYVTADTDAAGMTLTLRAMQDHPANNQTLRIHWP